MPILRILLLILSSSTLTACSMSAYHHSVELATLNSPTQALQRLSYQDANYRAKTEQGYEKNATALTTLKTNYQKQVNKIWGDKQSEFSTQYRYVKYINDYRSRSIIDFKQGTVRIETLEQENAQQYLKQAIEYTLLAPEQPQYTDFYTSYSSEIKGLPFLYQQVTDDDGKSIKWHWRASRYANYLIKHKYQQVTVNDKDINSVTFALTANHNKVRIQRYQPQIKQSAQHHNIDSQMVTAMIQANSLFNPYAISKDERIGLMQISTAINLEVFKLQKKYAFEPQPNWLFNNAHNLDIGIGYLSLLKQQLKPINKSKSRDYAMLASYIASPEYMLQTFSRYNDEAFDLINKLSAYEVYQSFTNAQSRREIKNYVYLVNRHFRQLDH